MTDIVRSAGRAVFNPVIHPRYRLASHAVRAGRIMFEQTNSKEGQLVAILLSLPLAVIGGRLSRTRLTCTEYLTEIASLLRLHGADYHWPMYGERAIRANLKAKDEAKARFAEEPLVQISPMPFHLTSESATRVLAAEIASIINRDGAK